MTAWHLILSVRAFLAKTLRHLRMSGSCCLYLVIEAATYSPCGIYLRPTCLMVEYVNLTSSKRGMCAWNKTWNFFLLMHLKV